MALASFTARASVAFTKHEILINNEAGTPIATQATRGTPLYARMMSPAPVAVHWMELIILSSATQPCRNVALDRAPMLILT